MAVDFPVATGVLMLHYTAEREREKEFLGNHKQLRECIRDTPCPENWSLSMLAADKQLMDLVLPKADVLQCCETASGIFLLY